jgi:hypothetical protein
MYVCMECIIVSITVKIYVHFFEFHSNVCMQRIPFEPHQQIIMLFHYELINNDSCKRE